MIPASTLFTCTALPNGETIDSVTLVPAPVLTPTTPAGTPYTVTPVSVSGSNGFVSNNYDITYAAYSGTVAWRSLSSYTIDTIAKQYFYGKVLTPAVTIPGLTEGTDFTVSYLNNDKVGTATATAKGIGNYTGSTSATFTIAQDTSPPTTIPAEATVRQARPVTSS
jgi:hypothetical protein